MTLAAIALGIITVGSLAAVSILLGALDTARRINAELDDECERLRAAMVRQSQAVMDMQRLDFASRSDASRKGHQTRKRRQVAAKVLMQDNDVQAMLGM